MLKKEEVYLYISALFMERNIAKFTQKSISEELKLSLSVVNNALKPLERMHSISINNRGFELVDLEKLLVYWATIRDLEKDILYSTFVPENVSKIESSLPGGVIFTAYSGYKFKLEAPSDYSKVYAYYDKKINDRFPERKGPSNLFILKSSPLIKKLSKENVAPLPLIFVDLWNLEDWYAKEFLKDFRRRYL